MPTDEFVVAIPMPFMGESIVDGILVNWLVEPGDVVEKGQHVAEIETEKSVWEFESPCAGTIESLAAEPGDVVDVEAPLFEIRTRDDDVRHLAEADDEPTEAEAPETRSASSRRGPALSPRIKKMLRDAGIDESEWASIAEKNGGRVTADQVERYIRGLKEQPDSTPERPVTTECYVLGIGTCAPERIVANDHFTEHFEDIDEAYIEKVTGIRERRWVDGETTSDLAINAARRALEEAEIGVDAIDMVILATTTPDMPLPATACVVAAQLGCRDIPAFDMQAACSGWLYGLSIGKSYIERGVARHVLVIAAETMSTFTDITDRATGFLFGDGAGAAVLGTDTRGHRLSNVVMKTDTAGYDIIYRKAGGAAMPFRSMDSPRDEYWVMDGGRMFRSAVSGFSDAIVSVVAQEGIELSDVSWFVPHQANQRILKTVAHRLKADPRRFFSNIHRYGNTSAASIPLALVDLLAQHELERGEKLLLCSVGAGLTSAGCLIEW